jgi:hypothetical protein
VDVVPHRLALLAETHELAGGERVRLRLTRPSDAPLVRDFLERASAGSDLRVRHFTFYDPRRRLVVAATLPLDGRECVVGLAEVAFRAEDEPVLVLVAPDEPEDSGLEALLAESALALAGRRAAA